MHEFLLKVQFRDYQHNETSQYNWTQFRALKDNRKNEARVRRVKFKKMEWIRFSVFRSFGRQLLCIQRATEITIVPSRYVKILYLTGEIFQIHWIRSITEPIANQTLMLAYIPLIRL